VWRGGAGARRTLVGERRDDVAERRERLVDGRALLETVARRSCALGTLRVRVGSHGGCEGGVVAPVLSARSDPARSTRFMSDIFSDFRPPPSSTICLTEMVMMVCARDEVAFIWVAATVRDAVPASIVSEMILYDPTAFALAPST
jgi:hypothetical protein